jgi:Asp-tRNA(Asn)/Glu-tRNA(Gln) amidotransferase A subunit family amidase
MLVGRRGDDATLLRVARAMELAGATYGAAS